MDYLLMLTLARRRKTVKAAALHVRIVLACVERCFSVRRVSPGKAQKGCSLFAAGDGSCRFPSVPSRGQSRKLPCVVPSAQV